MELALPPLRPCRLLRRKNRFLVGADVGPLHLANSGRMEELLRPGALGFYHPHPTPKTVGRLYLVEREGVLVGVDAHLPSRLLFLLLRSGTWGPVEAWAKEAPLLGERIDLWARIGGKEAYLEAKNANRLQGDLALFPDAPTPRGARQLRALAAWARGGGLAWVVWFVQHPKARALALDPADQELYRAFQEARKAGVRFLAYRVEPALEALRLREPLPLEEDLEGHHGPYG